MGKAGAAAHAVGAGAQGELVAVLIEEGGADPAGPVAAGDGDADGLPGGVARGVGGAGHVDGGLGRGRVGAVGVAAVAGGGRRADHRGVVAGGALGGEVARRPPRRAPARRGAAAGPGRARRAWSRATCILLLRGGSRRPRLHRGHRATGDADQATVGDGGAPGGMWDADQKTLPPHEGAPRRPGRCAGTAAHAAKFGRRTPSRGPAGVDRPCRSAPPCPDGRPPRPRGGGEGAVGPARGRAAGAAAR